MSGEKRERFSGFLLDRGSKCRGQGQHHLEPNLSIFGTTTTNSWKHNKLWWKISLTVIFEDFWITMLLALIRAFNLKENIYYILRRPWSDLRSLPLYTMINKKEIKIRLGYMFLSQRTFSKFIDEGYFGSAGVKSFCRSSFLFEK